MRNPPVDLSSSAFGIPATSRRGFIFTGATLAAGVVGAGLSPRFMPEAKADIKAAEAPQPTPVEKAPKPLSILILGGTGFLGPATIDAALARGHAVTIFNRGKREKYVGVRDHVEKLYGNRDPDKHALTRFVDGAEVEDETSPKGLTELEGRKWDAVIDNSGFVPRIVGASAKLLAPNVDQYVFISSVSAYMGASQPDADESDSLATIHDPTVEDMGPQFQNYGALKALSEKAAQEAMPGRVTVIRPGFIVGPDDTTDRFTYWPVRAAMGGDMLVPGTPDDPVQFIDVRDLAAFLVHCVETRAFDVMNVTGPEKPTTSGDLIDACAAAALKTYEKGVRLPAVEDAPPTSAPPASAPPAPAPPASAPPRPSPTQAHVHPLRLARRARRSARHAPHPPPPHRRHRGLSPPFHRQGPQGRAQDQAHPGDVRGPHPLVAPGRRPAGQGRPPAGRGSKGRRPPRAAAFPARASPDRPRPRPRGGTHRPLRENQVTP